MARSRLALGALGITLLLMTGNILWAQTPPPKPPAVPIKLQIVLARYDGDKKIASLPYTLIGSTGSNLTLNTGLQVPVTNSLLNPGPGAVTGAGAVTNFTYRPIGTNVSCTVESQPDGKFNLNLTLDNSSVVPDKGGTGSSGVPSFQSFTMHNNLIVGDGQTVQYASVTDPGNGMVTKVDLTLTVLK